MRVGPPAHPSLGAVSGRAAVDREVRPARPHGSAVNGRRRRKRRGEPGGSGRGLDRGARALWGGELREPCRERCPEDRGVARQGCQSEGWGRAVMQWGRGLGEGRDTEGAWLRSDLIPAMYTGRWVRGRGLWVEWSYHRSYQWGVARGDGRVLGGVGECSFAYVNLAWLLVAEAPSVWARRRFAYDAQLCEYAHAHLRTVLRA